MGDHVAGSTELASNDLGQSELTTMLEPGMYTVVVDGVGSREGAYNLSTTCGTTPPTTPPTSAPTPFPTKIQPKDQTAAAADNSTTSDDIATYVVVAVLGFLIVVGLVVAWRRQRHKPQGDVSNVGSTNDAEAPHPNDRDALSATSDDMLYEVIPALSLNKVTLADGPSSATPAIPSDRRPSYYSPPVHAAPSGACAVTQEHEARMPLRQRSSSYESVKDKLGLDDCPKPGPVAMAWVEKSSDGLPADRMAIEPDNTGVSDPNDGYIHAEPSTPATAVHPPVRPPDDMFGAASASLDVESAMDAVESAMDAVDTTHADYELPSKTKDVNLAPTVRPTVESAVDAAHADYELPMTIKVTKPTPTSGLEDQYAAVDYAEITGMAGDVTYEDLNSTGTVQPIEDATYDVIPPPSFDKDTLQGKMQDAVDAVDAAHADYQVPMPIKVTNPAPTSGLEPLATVHDDDPSADNMPYNISPLRQHSDV
jgi:hypothetical protein